MLLFPNLLTCDVSTSGECQWSSSGYLILISCTTFLLFVCLLGWGCCVMLLHEACAKQPLW